MYLFKKKVLFSALMLLLGLGMISNQAMAQEKANGKLYGKVIDNSSEKPIADVEVTLKSINKKVTTDEKGMYVFKSIPVGTYTVTVKAEGYQDWKKKKVKVTAKGKMLNIKLKPTEAQNS